MTSCSGMQLTKLVCPAATPAGQSLRHAARLQTVGEAARPATFLPSPWQICGAPCRGARGAIELDGTVTRVVYVLFMQRKLTITIDDALYQGLYRKVGPRKIARFIEEIVRPHVVDADLDSVYQEMAHDEAREREAEEWSEALLDDVAPGSTSRNEPR